MQKFIGGGCTNHIISLDGLDEYSIKSVIRNEDKDVKDVCEIKNSVITFHQHRKGETQCVMIAGRHSSSCE